MSEANEVKRDGAKLHKNSGRGIWQKADASLEPFVIDYKEYTESFSVSRKVWAKISTDAYHEGGQPALKLILGGDGAKLRLWVIDDAMFHEMRQAWLEKNENNN